mmetsp:Transcript_21143/g.56673  ORF Transcript_21143/g.56673 Transcript_21143/m.56673 type:complete len:365 (-) Transcript_21143:105-1199(-)
MPVHARPRLYDCARKTRTTKHTYAPSQQRGLQHHRAPCAWTAWIRRPWPLSLQPGLVPDGAPAGAEHVLAEREALGRVDLEQARQQSAQLGGRDLAHGLLAVRQPALPEEGGEALRLHELEALVGARRREPRVVHEAHGIQHHARGEGVGQEAVPGALAVEHLRRLVAGLARDTLGRESLGGRGPEVDEPDMWGADAFAGAEQHVLHGEVAMDNGPVMEALHAVQDLLGQGLDAGFALQARLLCQLGGPVEEIASIGELRDDARRLRVAEDSKKLHAVGVADAVEETVAADVTPRLLRLVRVPLLEAPVRVLDPGVGHALHGHVESLVRHLVDAAVVPRGLLELPHRGERAPLPRPYAVRQLTH